MTLSTDWTIFLRVTTQAKCDKAIEKIRQALGLPLNIERSERYWKDEQLFKVQAISPIEAMSPVEAFYTILKATNGVARLWTVNGPAENELWEFAGSAVPGSQKIVEIASIDFSTVGKLETTINAATLHVEQQ